MLAVATCLPITLRGIEFNKVESDRVVHKCYMARYRMPLSTSKYSRYIDRIEQILS
jgi:hypothetical protein